METIKTFEVKVINGVTYGTLTVPLVMSKREMTTYQHEKIFAAKNTVIGVFEGCVLNFNGVISKGQSVAEHEARLATKELTSSALRQYAVVGMETKAQLDALKADNAKLQADMKAMLELLSASK